MRKFILIVAALAMLSLSGAVFAQGTTPQTFCGNLSSADCDILTQSEAAMKALDSDQLQFQRLGPAQQPARRARDGSDHG